LLLWDFLFALTPPQAADTPRAPRGTRPDDKSGEVGRSRSSSHVDVAEANPTQGHRPRRQRVSPLLPSPLPLALGSARVWIPGILLWFLGSLGVRFGCGWCECCLDSGRLVWFCPVWSLQGREDVSDEPVSLTSPPITSHLAFGN
jgi:hypothetical protein